MNQQDRDNDVKEIDNLIENLQKRKAALQRKEPEIPDTEIISRVLKTEVQNLNIEKIPSFDEEPLDKKNLFRKNKETLHSMVLDNNKELNALKEIKNRNQIKRNSAKETINNAAKSLLSQKQAEIIDFCGDGRQKAKNAPASKKKELLTKIESKINKAKKVSLCCRPG